MKLRCRTQEIVLSFAVIAFSCQIAFSQSATAGKGTPGKAGESSQNAKRLEELRTIGTGDKDTIRAATLVAELNQAKDLTLKQTLQAMKGATPIGKNWLSGIASSQYRLEASKAKADLEAILTDRTQDEEARYKAFVWLTNGNEKLKSELLPKLIDDPSPEIRHTSIASQLANAKDPASLGKLLDAARHADQVIEIIKKLDEVGVKVDQAKHFGFLRKWNLIGPFDHVGTKNFNKSFAVEEDWIANKEEKTYEGKKANVSWMEYTSEEKDGNVDLAAIFANEKGCIVYAASEFDSPIDGPAEIRLGSINGHKIWVNGELVMTNEVYHSASQVDQYIDPIQLKKGKNRILIKICQNEQTEAWAQRYQFMVRIADSTGKAIQSND